MKKIPLIFGILFMFFILNSVNVHAYISGLSYQNINIQDDNIFGSEAKKLWLINWKYGGTDYISGYIGKDEFKSQTGYESKQNFNIKMQLTDDYGKYPFSKKTSDIDLKRVQFVSLTEWGASVDKLWSDAGCVDFNGNGYRDSQEYVYTCGLAGYCSIYCVRWGDKIASVYSPYSKIGIWKTKWTLNADGKEPVVKTLTNNDGIKEGTSTWFYLNGKRISLIKWGGSLTTGRYLPEYSGIKVIDVIYWPTGGPLGKRIVDESDYHEYVNYLTGNGLSECLNNWAQGIVKKNTCEEAVDNYIQTAVRYSTNPSFPKDKINFGDGYFKLIIDENKKIFIPSFTLYVNADYLQINIPVGIPKILKATSSKFIEDEPGHILVTVKNDGTGEGDFELKIIKCSKYFDFTSDAKSFPLGAGQTTTISLDISGSSDELHDTHGTCIVRFKEKTNGKYVDSDPIPVSFEQKTTCDPGNTWKRIENGVWVVKKCHSDGLTTETILTCKVGEEARLIQGEWKCVSPQITPIPPIPITPPTPITPTPSGCAWWDIGCQLSKAFEGIKTFFMWLGILMGIIIIIILVIKIVLR